MASSGSSCSSSSCSTGTPSLSSSSPCAACKFLRRKCMAGCIFAPYFPPEEPHKFANVHKIFGASNVTKLLNELLPHQREDAVNSLAYEAEARVKDPVYGCVGAISVLQRQVHKLQKDLDAANAHLLSYANANANANVNAHVNVNVCSTNMQMQHHPGSNYRVGIGVALAQPHVNANSTRMMPHVPLLPPLVSSATMGNYSQNAVVSWPASASAEDSLAVAVVGGNHVIMESVSNTAGDHQHGI